MIKILLFRLHSENFSHKIGSIEPGNEADLLILDVNPLDYRTWVDTATCLATEEIIASSLSNEPVQP